MSYLAEYYEDIDEGQEAYLRGEEPPKREPPKPPALHLVDATEFDEVYPPQRAFIVQDVLPRKSTVLATGKPGVGKGHLILQLAECLRRGEPFLGRKTTAGSTLIYSCEDDRDELHRRLHRIQRSLGPASRALGRILLAPRVGENNALIAFDAKTGISSPTEAFQALEAAVVEHRIDLIAIDTVAQTFPGSENDRAMVTAFVNQCAGLALRQNACVILVAHPPKNEAEYSGSTGWEGTVRARILFRKEDDDGVRRYFLKLAKANYSPEFEDELVRDDNGVLYLADKAPPSMADKINAYQDLVQYKTIFLTALDILARQGRAVSHSNRAPNFAPKAIIAAELGGGCSAKHLTAAMEALFKDGVITANAVVGKKPNRVPITGIARTIPLKAQADQQNAEGAVGEHRPSDGTRIDLNQYSEAAE